MKKKKIFLIIGGIVLLLVGVLVAYFILKKDDAKKLEHEVTMYVKINPLVKLVYTEVYEECTNEKGQTYFCNFVEGPVKDYELVNNDAKDIYDKLDFKGKELFDVITELCDTARENHVGFKSLEISSNSKYVNPEVVKEEVSKNSRYETTYEVLIDFQEYVEEEKTVTNLEETHTDKLKAYVVTFDSDGGSSIKQQSIIEGDLVGNPGNPTKEGYTFVEWQLNGKAFNFAKTVINADTTLKATWKEAKAEENNNTEPTTKPQEEQPVNNVKKYTVKFDSNGGSKVANQTVEENKTVTSPTNPTKKYNEFVEWQLNGQAYDFTTPVTKNITLKAKWKEVSPELEKINLNNNIMIMQSGNGVSAGSCGMSSAHGYYLSFVTNLSTLFPGKTFKYYSNSLLIYVEDEYYNDAVEEYGEKVVVKESEWNAKKDQLTYDTAKENSMINTFKSMQNNTKPGFTKLQYEFSNHNLAYAQYAYIRLEDDKAATKFPNLYNYLDYYITKQNNTFNNAVKGLIRINPYGGACGDSPYPELLDETLCSEYNLPCGRW